MTFDLGSFILGVVVVEAIEAVLLVVIARRRGLRLRFPWS